MKLNEWKDSSGKKVTIPTKSSSGNKTSSGGFKKRLEKLVDYHIAHKDKSVDKIVERYVADYGFIYSEHHGGGIGGYTNKIVMLIDDQENWEYSVFMDDKKLTQNSGKTWEKFVYSISDYLALPLVTSDPDYQELLKEWVDTSGKKINISSQNTSGNTSSKPAGKTNKDRFQELINYMENNKPAFTVSTEVIYLNAKGFKYSVTRKPSVAAKYTLTLTVGLSEYGFIITVYRNNDYLDDAYADGWEELLIALRDSEFGAIVPFPKPGSNEYDSICESLTEWVDGSGNKVNTNNTSQNISLAAQVNPLDQTARYKKLLAKIDSEKKFTYDIKELSTRVLAIVIDNELIRKFVRIIYSPSKESYLVQISESPDVRCDYWKTVLQVLVGAGIIKNTSESLDNSSIAEDFKEYESLWD